jgi:aminoglycoside N3'-acetyltransferase
MNYPVENKDQFDKIAATLRKVDYDIAFIHSDIFYGFKFGKKLSRIQQLQAHWQALKNLIDDRPIWMPAFNYDFPKTHQFDVLTSKSQVGVLPEFFRTQVASWRSCVPIFSFSGDDKTPISHVSAIIDPFDELSLFHSLVKKKRIDHLLRNKHKLLNNSSLL